MIKLLLVLYFIPGGRWTTICIHKIRIKLNTFPFSNICLDPLCPILRYILPEFSGHAIISLKLTYDQERDIRTQTLNKI